MPSALERRRGDAQSTQPGAVESGAAEWPQDLRVGEANDGVTLGELQRDRAKIQIDAYQDWSISEERIRGRCSCLRGSADKCC